MKKRCSLQKAKPPVGQQKPHRSPAKWVRCGGEARRNEREMTFIKSRRERFAVRDDYHLNIFKCSPDYLESCSTALLGRAAFAVFERISAGKTSAEGRLRRPEHSNAEGWSRPPGGGTQNERTSVRMSFHFGDPAEIRTPDTLLKRQVLCRLSYWVI